MNTLDKFLINLSRAKSDDVRCDAACQLKNYIAGDLQEEGGEKYNKFVDELNHKIVTLSNSSDVNDKKAAVLSIVALIEADNKSFSQPQRYNKSLTTINLTCNDDATLRLSTWAMGRLARAEGNLYDRFIEPVMDKAFEILDEKVRGSNRESNASHKMAAILIIREMAINAPTYFFHKLDYFQKLLVKVLKDGKKEIRFAAIAALRASLTIVAQRETNIHNINDSHHENNEARNYYETLLKKAMLLLDGDTDEIKGGIMIIIEMLRSATTRGDLLTYEENCYGGSENVSLLKIIGLSSLTRETACLIHNNDPSDSTLTYDKPKNVFGEEGHHFSQQCKKLLEDGQGQNHSNFVIIGEKIQRIMQKNYKSQEIQFLLTEILPRLAAFNSSLFQEHFLSDTFNYLTTQAKNFKPQGLVSPAAFLAIGQIAFSMKDGIICYIDKIFTVIKPFIPNPNELSKYRRTTNAHLEGNVLQLISLLAKATREKFHISIGDCIDGMLFMTLTKALTDCLAVLHTDVPAVKDKIQDGLLNIFSLIIMKVPHVKQSKSIAVPADYEKPTDTNSKLLAIKTIGKFNFDDKLLKPFITNLANDYLNHANPEIRRETAKTCARKLVPCVKATNTGLSLGARTFSPHTMMTDVLTKLLGVVIADPLAEIRLATLREFSTEFYKQLALSENIQLLFLAVNDPSHDVREVVLELLGHLSDENPAYILPFLREQLSHILHQFEHSGLARNKERAAKLLHILIKSAQPTLVKLYLKPIMSILMPKLKSPELSSSLFRHILACISQLAEVDGNTMITYLDDLFPFLIKRISDIKEREPSLKAMYYLVRHTGFVVKPYEEYPQLLDTLLNIISTENSPEVRGDCMRLLGQLGALSPYKNNKVNLNELRKFPITQPVPNEDVSFNTGLTSELLIQKQSDKDFNMDKQYYPCVVINALMNILQDKSLNEFHSQVVQIIITVFQRLGSTGTVGYLPKVMPTFLENIKTSEPKVVDSYFNKLADLTKIVGIHIKPYANDIIKLIIEFWNKGSDSDSLFQNTIMMVVERLINALGGEFKTYIAQLIPLIMKVLHDDQSMGREATKRLLTQLKNFGTTLDNYLHLLLPQIVAIIGDTSNEMEIRKRAVRTIRDIAEYADYSEHSSLMLHTLVSALETPDMDYKNDIMNAILAIAKQLGFRFRIFRPLVRTAVSRHQLIVPEFDAFVTQLNSSDQVLPVVPPLEISTRQMDHTTSEATNSKLNFDVDALQNVWEVKNLFHKDLVLWLRQLKIEFLKYAPNPALRACFMLAHYQNLAEDLFNAVFVSIWSDQLTEHQQDKLGENLKRVLENQSIPEVTLAILNLQEFMEHWGKGTLDIRNEVFAKAAKKCNSFAKALYYTEKDFLQQEPGTLVELLRINNILQQPKAALGVLKYAQMNPSKLNTPEDSWYEELQQWDEALYRYNDKLEQNHHDRTTYVLGKLRCLEALNRWEEMQSTIDLFWSESANKMNDKLAVTRGRAESDAQYRSDLSTEEKSNLASLGATAAWRLSRWKDLRKYTHMMDMGYQKNFFSAVIAVNNNEYEAAQELIDQSRENLDQEITVIVKEGYHRLYTKIVDMHMLSEMEEVVAFKNSCYSRVFREYKTESEMLKRREERKDRLRDVWWERLQGCQKDVSDWSRILEVHKLVLKPEEDEKAWLKFSSIARSNGQLDLSKRILHTLIGSDPSLCESTEAWLESTQNLSPYVVYQYLKYEWNAAENEVSKRRAYNMLTTYVQQGLSRVDSRNSLRMNSPAGSDRRLMSKYKLKQGLWLYNINEASHTHSHPNPAISTLEFFNEAKELDKRWYKSWHMWAMMNFKAARPERLKALKDEFKVVNDKIKRLQGGPLDEEDEDDEDLDDEDDEIDSSDEISEGGHDSSIIRLPDPSANTDSGADDVMNLRNADQNNEELQELLRQKESLGQEIGYKYNLITYAVSGFIESITLSLDSNLLQDVLRLLTLWFTHGSNKDVNFVLKSGIMRIPIKTWMQVIPQLIARIDMSERNVRDLIHQVLNDVGREHPQALIYPLSVAERSSDGHRGEYAGDLLNLMREHTPRIVEEGSMFSNELIRIAMSWNEQWYEALEKASIKWFTDGNSKAMFEILSPMHKLINPELTNPDTKLTELEKSFKNVNDNELSEAYDHCKHFKNTECPDTVINQAWDCYFRVYKRIGQSINSMNSVRLEDASPILLNQAKDMCLAVPGTYDPGLPVVRIHSIDPSVSVIKSKIRPRKLGMIGSDGNNYTFLLKGNEDLRQDERAMQLFGLVNSLLATSQKTSQQNLSIQRYSVIPLSPYSGLSGWRPHSDTLHLLIKEHRERNKVTPTLETKLCQKFCFNYEKLPLMMKIEVFEEVLEITKGEDLAAILYQRSPSAEVWLERRKNYILSHAVMSMVGYILGLGDRHPSNIMMDRKTGNLIHCDFGECFDVSRDRDKYPEKVPFRLTRMMQKAMEVTGIHGTYTLTCNDVMDVLRTNENSILAVLETFVYDPLINWRLVEDYEADGHVRNIQERSNETKINKKAVEILEKVRKKLTGFDDVTERYLDVENQVQSLIKQATATENLCQLYMGWCPFW